MKALKIGYDSLLKKDIKKIRYESKEMPKVQLFNSADVIVGNASSNVAIGFVYTWRTDFPPEEIRNFFNRISNYAALTGYWRTTNGGRYAFSNILANPNINKLLLLVFNNRDNGHLLADSVEKFWKFGTNKNGLIINCNSPNPKFEQVPMGALDVIRTQCDLIVMNSLTPEDFDRIEKVIKACIQEPRSAIDESELRIKLLSNTMKNGKIYDDGCRFDTPYFIDLSTTAQNVKFKQKNLLSTVGQSVQAKNLNDALQQIAAFIYENGSGLVDERGIITIESRSFSVTIINPLEVIPDGFNEQYLKKYVKEFMEGVGEGLDEFAYTYHDRIFKRWGNQVEKIIDVLKKHPNTRRALISLWDPTVDLGHEAPPCLDFIWCTIRNNALEMHVIYRSHHLATITEDGRVMKGEGAFVPNIYALAHLQQHIADKLDLKRGPFVLTDFSGHLYVSKIKKKKK